MRDQPALAQADWLLICDVDEFLVLHEGDGTIGSHLDRVGRGFLGMAFHWRNFGTSGWQRYRDGLVHRQFQRCGPAGHGVNAMFKMMFKTPLRFKRYSDHSPYQFDGDWAAPENRVVDCAGRLIDRFITDKHPIRFTTPEGITHATAQMNHYVLRSVEGYNLKRGQPSASAFKDRYTDQFFRARDRNGCKDSSALIYQAAFDKVHAEAMALPGISQLHHLCCADYVRSLCESQGKPPEDDPRWQAHMAQI